MMNAVFHKQRGRLFCVFPCVFVENIFHTVRKRFFVHEGERLVSFVFRGVGSFAQPVTQPGQVQSLQ